MIFNLPLLYAAVAIEEDSLDYNDVMMQIKLRYTQFKCHDNFILVLDFYLCTIV